VMSELPLWLMLRSRHVQLVEAHRSMIRRLNRRR
jgi:hypothetical protein